MSRSVTSNPRAGRASRARSVPGRLARTALFAVVSGAATAAGTALVGLVIWWITHCA